jgi:transposase
MIFQNEIRSLKTEITALKAKINELLAVNARQQEQITLLRKENEELKERLGINSSNSSLPPSQDLKRKGPAKKSSGRKPGGQPGHKGHSRRLFPPEQVQNFVEVLPESCPECGDGTLNTKRPISTERRQQIELPEIKPQVTQFNIHTCLCRKCGRHVAAALPPEARRGFGPRLMGFLMILSAEARATRSVCVRLLGHLGISISSGSVSNIQKLAVRVLESPYEAIKAAALSQSHLHADETSWRSRGKKHWIWVGATPSTVFFKIDSSRSQAAFKRVFAGYKNSLTVDRYGAYNIHEGEKQTCWAHLARDFAKIAERGGADGLIGRLLQEQTSAVFSTWHKFLNLEQTREEMRCFVEQELMPNFEVCLRVGAASDEMRTKTRSTCCDLLTRFKTLWLFLYKEGVEPTNNLSERELRSAVLRRKISLGSQSEWGERFVERVLTVTATFRQMAKNTYEYFTKCFQAWQRNHSIPLPI